MTTLSELAGKVAALEEENRELRALMPQKTVDLDGGPASYIGTAPPSPKTDRVATVLTMPPDGLATQVPPDDLLRRVFAIVAGKYPAICGRGDPSFFDAFKCASLWLGHVGRLDEPDTQHDIVHHGERCISWLKAVGRNDPNCDPTAALLAASVGCVDVPFVLLDRPAGQVPAIGIAGPGAGRRAKPQWEDLAKGYAVLRQPSVIAYPTGRAAYVGPVHDRLFG
jgi:hypothetical protein